MIEAGSALRAFNLAIFDIGTSATSDEIVVTVV
jgi:hypothetical protein